MINYEDSTFNISTIFLLSNLFFSIKSNRNFWGGSISIIHQWYISMNLCNYEWERENICGNKCCSKKKYDHYFYFTAFLHNWDWIWKVFIMHYCMILNIHENTFYESLKISNCDLPLFCLYICQYIQPNYAFIALNRNYETLRVFLLKS